jgi:hypothetical protein
LTAAQSAIFLQPGLKAGVHNGDSRAMAPSVEEVIADFHNISRYVFDPKTG